MQSVLWKIGFPIRLCNKSRLKVRFFSINEGVRVFIDISLKYFDAVYITSGNLYSLVQVMIDKSKTHSMFAGGFDLCKGWYVNENE
ncbi:hypothetical protein [Bacillus thuringiensis]|uniref:hypothetical protein n=1 Tax=Bacillus thuringiensis TaxID=1428 RepID=UPI000BF41780|nr:hypothetical protein [Bacillus thuringiensis]PFF71081.1 hypothetical protein CN334_00075 [Bacillus thuringiensis]PGR92441.1 hypothetical protein COC68_25665 [Bacillus thuringiensis]